MNPADPPADSLAAPWRDVHQVVHGPTSPLPWAQPPASTPAPGPAPKPEPAPEPETKKEEEKPGFIDTWSPRVALAATIGLTASGEFALAQLAGWHPGIAWLLPTAIDVYVVQSFRRHRDVAAALTLMVVANAVYHLADRGLFGVATKGGEIVRNANGDPRPTWWLIVGVAAIAPLVMWRIHRITAPKPQRQKHRQNPPVLAPVQRQEQPANTPPVAPPTVASKPANNDHQNTAPVANTARQNHTPKKAPAAARKPAKTTAKKPAAGAKTRRSLDEWVQVAEPVFHAEFQRLRRQPTANEFATAIKKAGHGTVSDSTAKNIRAEILDRAELPALEN